MWETLLWFCKWGLEDYGMCEEKPGWWKSRSALPNNVVLSTRSASGGERKTVSRSRLTALPPRLQWSRARLALTWGPCPAWGVLSMWGSWAWLLTILSTLGRRSWASGAPSLPPPAAFPSPPPVLSRRTPQGCPHTRAQRHSHRLLSPNDLQPPAACQSHSAARAWERGPEWGQESPAKDDTHGSEPQVRSLESRGGRSCCRVSRQACGGALKARPTAASPGPQSSFKTHGQLSHLSELISAALKSSA